MSLLTLQQARTVLDAALAKASEIGSPSSITVLDAGREPQAFARMDDAVLASSEISHNKAYTAISMKMATADLYEFTQPGGPFYGLQTAQSRPFVVFGGGLPLTVDGVVVGSIGVAGGSADQDVEIAAAGLAALN